MTRTKAGKRKLRLFAVACCRSIWQHLPEALRQIVAVAEQYAEGQAGVQELAAAQANAAQLRGLYDPADPATMQQATAEGMVAATVYKKAFSAAFAMTSHAPSLAGFRGTDAEADAMIAKLVRHVFGDPFQPYPVAALRSQTIVGLARALDNGDDNRLILADALEEFGHQDLADHFRQEDWHPKGCWALDLILGKS